MTVQDRVGRALAEVPTPALVVDLDALARNVARMAAFARHTGIGVRPHTKGHKSPAIAHMQMRAGAIGICCQKLAEAEVMVQAGLDRILVTNQVVGEAKLRRLAALARFAEVTVAVDDVEVARATSAAARAAGVTLGAVVEVDVGGARCGVAPADAVALGRALAGLDGLIPRGLQVYMGRNQHLAGQAQRDAAADRVQAVVGEVAAGFRAAGLALEIVTGAGTGTFAREASHGHLTDVQPGSYVFMDAHYRGIGGEAGPVYDAFETALCVHATVISTPVPARAIVDAGTKTLSTDSGPAQALLPGWTYAPSGDEHGALRAGAGAAPLAIGARLRLLPSHCDTTVALHDRYVVASGDTVVAVWPVAARGMLE